MPHSTVRRQKSAARKSAGEARETKAAGKTDEIIGDAAAFIRKKLPLRNREKPIIF